MSENSAIGRIWHVPKLASEQKQAWDELYRIAPMSFGIYTLPAGGNDSQSPHNEDEAYYVIGGKSKMEIGDALHDIGAGDLIFVPRHTHHRYIEIEEDLTLLAFIAPAFKST